MPKYNFKNKQLFFDKICRSCLTERGSFRNITSTRIPMMMETCASVQVHEKDDLPKQLCISCFRQITKFYCFKRKMERSEKILKAYLKQHKQRKGKLNKASSVDCYVEIKHLSSSEDDDTPLSEYKVLSDDKSDFEDGSSKGVVEIDYSELVKVEGVEFFGTDPPPLVPLASTTQVESAPLKSVAVQDLPPLVPIKASVEFKSVVSDRVVKQNIDLKLSCPLCTEMFSSVFKLKQHRLFHCQSAGMQCNICKKEFQERSRLINHLKRHMVSKDHICQLCGKCYPNPSTFRIHMRSHTGERPFSCQVCNKGFTRWAGVVEHMKTHSSFKPYKCDTCGKSFKISSNLERHKVLHSGILPYCCSYCGKTFSQSNNLLLHVRTYHTNERPYLCSECGKSFVSLNRLNRHRWVHSGYKPYKCRMCTKSYFNSNDLKIHEKIHWGGVKDSDKPYKCTLCESRFFHPCRLSKHMKIHEKLYSCSKCGQTFHSEKAIKKHFATEHPHEDGVWISSPKTIEDTYEDTGLH